MTSGHTWRAHLAVATLLFALMSASCHVASSQITDYAFTYGKKGVDWQGVCTDPRSRFQSPVDITSCNATRVSFLGDLQRRARYTSSRRHVSLAHDNHTVDIFFSEPTNYIQFPMLNVQPYNNSVTWPPNTYTLASLGKTKPRVRLVRLELRQCHVHWESEHDLDGRHRDIEVHCVHTAQDPGQRPAVGVVGVFLNRTRKGSICKCDPMLETILSALPMVVKLPPKVKMPVAVRGFSAARFFPRDKTYFHYYPGSLTTPPCSEGLLWYVFRETKPICQRHFQLIADAITALNGRGEQNARDPQSLRGRVIYQWSGH
ncbi:hypothetical protein CBR_g54091 [Chara braunii]|uniref:carbonic anhydrase n=1 Tax=Chara braunii TaxID=69332 RepID=A0A388MBQ9_CHABU|nr:hypothetical protein CBR_g54091 [Chara braunii]|eukprot:GBG91996.1 hypothetical protein CBR_g54091 [Chara braunii]